METQRIVLTTEQAAIAIQLLKNLEKEEESYQFHFPVDWEALGLEDYPIIVKSPMDLSTIKRKIKA
ncbi:MAG: hypothetical protein V2I33_22710 [Kangiellaceae bacterium]|jgi:bromodomain-containing factor 1|nr:hypothetical protein [Kangiellaceae bacterium]